MVPFTSALNFTPTVFAVPREVVGVPGVTVGAQSVHALRDGVSGGNGVFKNGNSNGFPNTTTSATNYWVDVVFAN